jgi:hypothetical protein
MGAEAACTARIGGKATKGRARLETDVLEFRGPNVRVSIPFREMTSVAAHDGALTIDSDLGTLSLSLGKAAEKWAHKILHPPSRLDKIGVKPHWRVSVLGAVEEAFLAELEGRVAGLSIGRVRKDSDVIFFAVTKERELARLAKLAGSLQPDGALWIIRPKGRPDISERGVMAAGKAAGLVDVKVVRFSPTHTAEKFVIPVKNR